MINWLTAVFSCLTNGVYLVIFNILVHRTNFGSETLTVLSV